MRVITISDNVPVTRSDYIQPTSKSDKLSVLTSSVNVHTLTKSDSVSTITRSDHILVHPSCMSDMGAIARSDKADAINSSDSVHAVIRSDYMSAMTMSGDARAIKTCRPDNSSTVKIIGRTEGHVKSSNNEPDNMSAIYRQHSLTAAYGPEVTAISRPEITSAVTLSSNASTVTKLRRIESLNHESVKYGAKQPQAFSTSKGSIVNDKYTEILSQSHEDSVRVLNAIPLFNDNPENMLARQPPSAEFTYSANSQSQMPSAGQQEMHQFIESVNAFNRMQKANQLPTLHFIQSINAQSPMPSAEQPSTQQFIAFINALHHMQKTKRQPTQTFIQCVNAQSEFPSVGQQSMHQFMESVNAFNHMQKANRQPSLQLVRCVNAQSPMSPAEQRSSQQLSETVNAKSPMPSAVQRSSQQLSETVNAKSLMPSGEQRSPQQLVQSVNAQIPMASAEQRSSQQLIQSVNAQIPMPSAEQRSSQQLSETVNAQIPMPSVEQRSSQHLIQSVNAQSPMSSAKQRSSQQHIQSGNAQSLMQSADQSSSQQLIRSVNSQSPMPSAKQRSSQRLIQSVNSQSRMPSAKQRSSRQLIRSLNSQSLMPSAEQRSSQQLIRSVNAQSPMSSAEQRSSQQLIRSVNTQSLMPSAEQRSSQQLIQSVNAQILMPSAEQMSSQQLSKTVSAQIPMPSAEQRSSQQLSETVNAQIPMSSAKQRSSQQLIQSVNAQSPMSSAKQRSSQQLIQSGNAQSLMQSADQRSSQQLIRSVNSQSPIPSAKQRSSQRLIQSVNSQSPMPSAKQRSSRQLIRSVNSQSLMPTAEQMSSQQLIWFVNAQSPMSSAEQRSSNQLIGSVTTQSLMPSAEQKSSQQLIRLVNAQSLMPSAEQKTSQQLIRPVNDQRLMPSAEQRPSQQLIQPVNAQSLMPSAEQKSSQQPIRSVLRNTRSPLPSAEQSSSQQLVQLVNAQSPVSPAEQRPSQQLIESVNILNQITSIGQRPTQEFIEPRNSLNQMQTREKLSTQFVHSVNSQQKHSQLRRYVESRRENYYSNNSILPQKSAEGNEYCSDGTTSTSSLIHSDKNLVHLIDSNSDSGDVLGTRTRIAPLSNHDRPDFTTRVTSKTGDPKMVSLITGKAIPAVQCVNAASSSSNIITNALGAEDTCSSQTVCQNKASTIQFRKIATSMNDIESGISGISSAGDVQCCLNIQPLVTKKTEYVAESGSDNTVPKNLPMMSIKPTRSGENCVGDISSSGKVETLVGNGIVLSTNDNARFVEIVIPVILLAVDMNTLLQNKLQITLADSINTDGCSNPGSSTCTSGNIECCLGNTPEETQNASQSATGEFSRIVAKPLPQTAQTVPCCNQTYEWDKQFFGTMSSHQKEASETPNNAQAVLSGNPAVSDKTHNCVPHTQLTVVKDILGMHVPVTKNQATNRDTATDDLGKNMMAVRNGNSCIPNPGKSAVSTQTTLTMQTPQQLESLLYSVDSFCEISTHISTLERGMLGRESGKGLLVETKETLEGRNENDDSVKIKSSEMSKISHEFQARKIVCDGDRQMKFKIFPPDVTIFEQEDPFENRVTAGTKSPSDEQGIQMESVTSNTWAKNSEQVDGGDCIVDAVSEDGGEIIETRTEDSMKCDKKGAVVENDSEDGSLQKYTYVWIDDYTNGGVPQRKNGELNEKTRDEKTTEGELCETSTNEDAENQKAGQANATVMSTKNKTVIGEIPINRNTQTLVEDENADIPKSIDFVKPKTTAVEIEAANTLDCTDSINTQNDSVYVVAENADIPKSIDFVKAKTTAVEIEAANTLDCTDSINTQNDGVCVVATEDTDSSYKYVLLSDGDMDNSLGDEPQYTYVLLSDEEDGVDTIDRSCEENRTENGANSLGMIGETREIKLNEKSEYFIQRNETAEQHKKSEFEESKGRFSERLSLKGRSNYDWFIRRQRRSHKKQNVVDEKDIAKSMVEDISKSKKSMKDNIVCLGKTSKDHEIENETQSTNGKKNLIVMPTPTSFKKVSNELDVLNESHATLPADIVHNEPHLSRNEKTYLFSSRYLNDARKDQENDTNYLDEKTVNCWRISKKTFTCHPYILKEKGRREEVITSNRKLKISLKKTTHPTSDVKGDIKLKNVIKRKFEVGHFSRGSTRLRTKTRSGDLSKKMLMITRVAKTVERGSKNLSKQRGRKRTVLRSVSERKSVRYACKHCNKKFSRPYLYVHQTKHCKLTPGMLKASNHELKTSLNELDEFKRSKIESKTTRRRGRKSALSRRWTRKLHPCRYCGKQYHKPYLYMHEKIHRTKYINDAHDWMNVSRIKSATRSLSADMPDPGVKNKAKRKSAHTVIKQTASFPVRRNKCDQCNFQCYSLKRLTNHKLVHTQMQCVSCFVCRVMFKNMAAYKIWHTKNNVCHEFDESRKMTYLENMNIRTPVENAENLKPEDMRKLKQNEKEDIRFDAENAENDVLQHSIGENEVKMNGQDLSRNTIGEQISSDKTRQIIFNDDKQDMASVANIQKLVVVGKKLEPINDETKNKCVAEIRNEEEVLVGESAEKLTESVRLADDLGKLTSTKSSKLERSMLCAECTYIAGSLNALRSHFIQQHFQQPNNVAINNKNNFEATDGGRMAPSSTNPDVNVPGEAVSEQSLRKFKKVPVYAVIGKFPGSGDRIENVGCKGDAAAVNKVGDCGDNSKDKDMEVNGDQHRDEHNVKRFYGEFRKLDHENGGKSLRSEYEQISADEEIEPNGSKKVFDEINNAGIGMEETGETDEKNNGPVENVNGADENTNGMDENNNGNNEDNNRTDENNNNENADGNNNAGDDGSDGNDNSGGGAGDGDDKDKENNNKKNENDDKEESKDIQLLSCLVCQTSFSVKVDLQRHLSKIHRLTNLCHLCYFKEGELKRFANPVSLRNHKLREHQEDMVRCICGSMLIDQKMLTSHLKKFKCNLKVSGQADNEMVKCLCGKRFESQELLASHRSKCRKRKSENTVKYYHEERTRKMMRQSYRRNRLNNEEESYQDVKCRFGTYEESLPSCSTGTSKKRLRDRKGETGDREESYQDVCNENYARNVKSNTLFATTAPSSRKKNRKSVVKDEENNEVVQNKYNFFADIEAEAEAVITAERAALVAHNIKMSDTPSTGLKKGKCQKVIPAAKKMGRKKLRCDAEGRYRCKKCGGWYKRPYIYIHQKTVHAKRQWVIVPTSMLKSKTDVTHHDACKKFRCGWCKFVSVHWRTVVHHHYSKHQEAELDVVTMATIPKPASPGGHSQHST